MNEQERDLRTPYWQQDMTLGEAMVAGEPTALHLLLHTARTRFHGGQALVRLRHQHGICLSLQGQPAVLDPAIAPVIDLGTHPGTSCVGSVGTAPPADLRYRSIGAAQAWYYPDDRLAVLWECSLFEPYRARDPVQDAALATVWSGFERAVRVQAGGPVRIVTPSWEPFYDQPAWQAFLRRQGYRPGRPGVFVTRSVV